MHRLERLLRPRSIAVFGGSFAANVVQQCRKMGFAGEVWPVHPSKAEVHGVQAYRGVDDLPDVPDAAFVGVNRMLTIDIVRQLRERGAGGAICFAAGFLEAGAEGARLQDELLAAAADMPIIGPNCYGLINYADGALLWPDQHGGERLSGGRGVAILTQSSNIAINMTMQKRGLPLAYVMTAGNQAQTGLSELALGLIEDERVSALGLHIEGFDSVEGFERLAARARDLGKPIVAMKVGRSEQARAGTLSHTASLAGSDAASDAFLRRLGIARLDSVPAFLEALKLVHVHGALPGNRLSSMSCSGGEASVMADSVEGRNLVFPALGEAHRERVGETLGPLVAVANPLDYHTFIWNDEEAMRNTFSAMVSGDFDLNMLVLDFPRSDRCSDADWQPTLRAFETALTTNAARGAVVASMPENMPEAQAQSLVARGIAPLFGIEEAMEAAQAASAIGAAWGAPPPAAVNGAKRGEARGGRETLDEASAKLLLREAGLRVPQGVVVHSPADAVRAAENLGYPIALKALGVAHKSEAGAVRLNLATEQAVEDAARDLLPLGSGVYVETMIAGGIAELIVGIVHDPLFGPVMTIGTGGVLVELLQDSATLLLPALRGEIERALRGLKMFPLLDGYRGRPKADVRAAIDAIRAIAAFALSNDLEELDINPLIVCAEGKGAWVADALMVRRKQ
ncbi:MAG: acetate--CoA ligase family protein [Rhizobiaceae bacterium]|nr:acetate--CoA ligase family protein [Rhizobiaceae bacterium]